MSTPTPDTTPARPARPTLLPVIALVVVLAICYPFLDYALRYTVAWVWHHLLGLVLPMPQPFSPPPWSV